MPIFEVTADAIRKIEETTFSAVGIRERADLQRLLRKQIDIISPETLVVAEEFGEWEDSNRRIDLLGIDRSANLVVIVIGHCKSHERKAPGTPFARGARERGESI